MDCVCHVFSGEEDKQQTEIHSVRGVKGCAQMKETTSTEKGDSTEGPGRNHRHEAREGTCTLLYQFILNAPDPRS